MHKIQKSKEDGKYHINGKIYDKLIGKRSEVGHGTAYKTSGGLTIDDLVYVKGRWKSKVKYETAKKELRLQKYGYFTVKGKFGYVKKSSSPQLRKYHLPAAQRIPSPQSPSYYGSKFRPKSYKKKTSSSNRSSRSSRSIRSSRS